jgi:hypothetical protein
VEATRPTFLGPQGPDLYHSFAKGYAQLLLARPSFSVHSAPLSILSNGPGQTGAIQLSKHREEERTGYFSIHFRPPSPPVLPASPIEAPTGMLEVIPQPGEGY